MGTPEMERRLAAVWFVDVAEFTRLSASDEPLAYRVMDAMRTSVRAAVKENGGSLVKYLGDGALAHFPSAAAAVEAGLEVHRRFRVASRPLPEGPHLLRVGIHLGEVAVGPDGDLFGDGVNRASRLQEMADPGCVLVSQPVRDLLRQRPDLHFSSRGERTAKGLDEPLRVHDVEPRGELAKRLDALQRAMRAPTPAEARTSTIRHPRAVATGITAGIVAFIGLGVWTALGGEKTDAAAEPSVPGLGTEVAAGAVADRAAGAGDAAGGAVDTAAGAVEPAEAEPGLRIVPATRLLARARAVPPGRADDGWLPPITAGTPRDARTLVPVADPAADGAPLPRWPAMAAPTPEPRAASPEETRPPTPAEELRTLARAVDRRLQGAGAAEAEWHETLPLLRRGVDEILAGEPTGVRLHVLRGLLLFLDRWDLEGAAAEFLEALRQDPGSPSVRRLYAALLTALGSPGEALFQLDRAEAADAAPATLRAARGATRFRSGDLAEAEEDLRDALERRPGATSVRLLLARTLVARTRYDEALRVLSEGEPGPHLQAWQTLAQVKQQGRELRPGDLWFLDRVEALPDGAYLLAVLMAAADRPDAALAYLDRAIAARSPSVVWLAVDPEWNALRGDPRFRQRLSRAGLAEPIT